MSCNRPFMRLVRASSSKTGCDYLVPTPCGHCRGCLKDYIQTWSDRCTFESQTQSRPSALVTLTYNDKHLPKNGVCYDDICNFNKRFRYFLTKSDSSRRYKYYLSSEYGIEDFRPHYHMMIFGFDPQSSYDMSALNNAWMKNKESIGFFEADFLTTGRIRYAMKYVNKELSPDRQDDILKRELNPLFHTMSKGIGFDWFFKNLKHIIENKGYIVNGSIRPLNRYYSDLFKLIDDKSSPYDSIKRLRNKFKSYNPFQIYNFDKSEMLLNNDLRERRLALHEQFSEQGVFI